MANTLTQQDMAQLQQYATAGDRYGYWNDLASKGNAYARLALGVVNGDTADGFAANHVYPPEDINGRGSLAGNRCGRQKPADNAGGNRRFRRRSGAHINTPPFSFPTVFFCLSGKSSTRNS
ncbi:MAG TPA: hypothetical protein DEP05_05875 [Betaproteobacteria bacterium]|nr:hypothetical protein [Betaproteobacteria bacterium]